MCTHERKEGRDGRRVYSYMFCYLLYETCSMKYAQASWESSSREIRLHPPPPQRSNQTPSKTIQLLSILFVYIWDQGLYLKTGQPRWKGRDRQTSRRASALIFPENDTLQTSKGCVRRQSTTWGGQSKRRAGGGSLKLNLASVPRRWIKSRRQSFGWSRKE